MRVCSQLAFVAPGKARCLLQGFGRKSLNPKTVLGASSKEAAKVNVVEHSRNVFESEESEGSRQSPVQITRRPHPLVLQERICRASVAGLQVKLKRIRDFRNSVGEGRFW